MIRRDVTPEDLAKFREWQARSARAYQEKMRAKRRNEPAGPDATPQPRKRSQRRNDGPWGAICRKEYGNRCIVPGCGETAVEVDHIKPRSQGGKSVVENGALLCGPWSRTIPGGHHLAKTESRLRYRWEWLTEGQRAYLAQIGWVDWDEDGMPFGEGWRHFEERGL